MSINFFSDTYGSLYKEPTDRFFDENCVQILIFGHNFHFSQNFDVWSTFRFFGQNFNFDHYFASELTIFTKKNCFDLNF